MARQACPALVISAPSSGQGKTSITAALAYSLRKEGKHVRVFKVGPDFLDPMILQHASGHPVYQLDLWMMGEPECKRLLAEASQSADFILVEGVMGLFDGTPSTADLAAAFNIPVLTVIDAKAMAQTLAAIYRGLATYRNDVRVVGVLANNVASDRHAQMVRKGFTHSADLIAEVRRNEQFSLPSRHLGLLQANEIQDLDTRISALASALNFDFEKLSQLAPHVEFGKPAEAPSKVSPKHYKIGIARDTAFSFIYQANIDLLEQMGASLSFFSPIADRDIPDCNALYFPGGYPELFINELAENQTMKSAIRKHFDRGLPIYSECGGMLYMLDELIDIAGNAGQMVGSLPGQAKMLPRLKSLDYQTFGFETTQVKGHTFHHSESFVKMEPTGRAKKGSDDSPGEFIYKNGSLTATYMHVYFPSSPEFISQVFHMSN